MARKLELSLNTENSTAAMKKEQKIIDTANVWQASHRNPLGMQRKSTMNWQN